MSLNKGGNYVAVHSMAITNCEEFDIKRKFGLNNRHILVDFELFAISSCLSFAYKMNLVSFIQRLQFFLL